MHTGDLLVEQLMGYGVAVIFGVPGGQTVALYDAIQRREPAIRHVTLRDERHPWPDQGAGNAAVPQLGGKEHQVVDVVARWILTGAAPDEIR